jgi:hypothetical protein
LIQQRNLKLIICAGGNARWGVTDDQTVEIVLNKNGAGDAWINGWAQFIQELQPYAIDIINEPASIESSQYSAEMTPMEWFAAYEAFAARCIDAWRAIKPDLVIHIENSPFWTNMERIIGSPIQRDDVVYALHVYYGLWNPVVQTWRPQFEKDYWGVGNLANAKANLESYLLNERGVQGLLDKGLKVVMEETGVPVDAPNGALFMQDMYDICKKYDIGVLHHALDAAPRESSGLLNSDWLTLNSIGQVWYSNMSGNPATLFDIQIVASANGTTNPTGTISVNQGSTVTVTVTPNTGYSFKNWLLDGVDAGTANPINILMDTNHALDAVFEQIVTPPPTKTVAARSIGPFGVPATLLHQLWRLRERFIRPEVHRKLHPLV